MNKIKKNIRSYSQLLSKAILNVFMENIIPLKKAVTQISIISGYNVSQEMPCNIINHHNFPIDEIVKIKVAISDIKNSILSPLLKVKNDEMPLRLQDYLVNSILKLN